jgi:DNA helicase IV
MSRMNMPGVDDLTSEQDRILRLPDEGRFFVGGPPGTGKTIVALLRAHAMTARSNSPTILMHNKLLKSYCTQWLAGRKLKLTVDTYNSWFCQHYRRSYGASPPMLPAKGKEKWQPYDWSQIEEAVAAKPSQPSLDPLLIDEGQDLPRAFYQYIGLHFQNIMVFADENQMLDEQQNSTKENIWAELAIPTDNRYILKTNHRNTLEIARVAQHFYAGTDAGKPDIPTRKGQIPPCLVDYGSLEYMAKKVVCLAGNRPHDLIAVMTANNKSQDAVRLRLEAECCQTKTRFTWYRSGNGAQVDFNRAGIVLLNLQSVKGLEFDSVLIADLHEHRVFSDSQAHKMKLYVATSRAKDRLYLLHNRTSAYPVLNCMPGENILKRHKFKDEADTP